MKTTGRIALFMLFVMAASFSTPQALSQSFGNIDTKFIFKLLYFSEGNQLGLAAHVSTTATYPCAGFGIKLTQLRMQDTITVIIGGLIRPNPCFQTESEATGKLFIGPLRSGDYILKIYYRGTSDLYRLTINQFTFSLKSIHIQFTEIGEY
jgi:hypothetical protein